MEKWGKERRCKSKRIKRKNKAPVTPSDHVCCKTSVHAVAEELQARTSCYSRTAKGLVSLVGWCRSKSAGGTSLLISFVHPRSTATLRPAARCAGFSSQLREGSCAARFRNPIGDSCPIPRSRHHRAPRKRKNDLVFCQEPGGRQDSVDLCRLDSVQSTTPARGLYSLGLVSGQDSRVQEYELIATRK